MQLWRPAVLLLALAALVASAQDLQEEATTTEGVDATTLTTHEPELRGEAKQDVAETTTSRPWWSLGIFPIRQRQQRCNCVDFTCGCCAGMALQTISISQVGCMNFTYDPDEFAVGVKFLMNEKTMMERQVSAKNPPPICFPIPSVISFIPRFDFCAKFFNVFTPGRNFHACLEWQTKVNSNPVLAVEFDCFRMGADGFVFLKPEAGGGLGPSQISPGGGGTGGSIDYGGGGAGTGVGEDYDPLEPEQPEKNKNKKKPAKKKPNKN